MIDAITKTKRPSLFTKSFHKKTKIQNEKQNKEMQTTTTKKRKKKQKTKKNLKKKKKT